MADQSIASVAVGAMEPPVAPRAEVAALECDIFPKQSTISVSELCHHGVQEVGDVAPYETLDVNSAPIVYYGLYEDPSTYLKIASSKVIVYNEVTGKFHLHTYNFDIEAEFAVALIGRVKELLEYQEEHGEINSLSGCALETSLDELDYPLVNDEDYLPVQRVLYKAFGRAYWREVLGKLWTRNVDVFGDALQDAELLLLVFRLTNRTPVQFDLVEVHRESSTTLVTLMSANSTQEAAKSNVAIKTDPYHVKSILTELGKGGATLWDDVLKEDQNSCGTLDMMTQRMSTELEGSSGKEKSSHYPHWPGDAALAYVSPDGADLGYDQLHARMQWYLHDSKEFIRSYIADCTEKEFHPVVRALSLQSYLAKQQIPSAFMSVNSFGMFRQIVNWFLVSNEKKDEMIDLYGDENAGLFHVPAVLHRAPDWQLLNGGLNDGLERALPRVIQALFLERLHGIPGDDDDRLAQFEGGNLASCSMSIANREMGESFLYYYSAQGVSWQSQRVSSISDEELLHECSNTASRYDDTYGDKSMLFDGYAEDLHQTLAELYVSFRHAVGGKFKSYAQLIALAGEDVNGPQSLKNYVYISGRFGNYVLSDMQRDEGLSLWRQVEDDVIARIRQDITESSHHFDYDDKLLDADIQSLIQHALQTSIQEAHERTNEQTASGERNWDADSTGPAEGLQFSCSLSNAELRMKLLDLEQDCWPSYASSTNKSSRCMNFQVRVVPNSAEHRAPIRTFRFFAEDDKRELSDFVEANMEKLESLKSIIENA